MADTQDNGVKLGITFAGESVLPGGANLLRGDLFQGGLHLLAGMAARAAFGLPGVLLVSANSFSKAVTGKHLVEHVGLWNTPRAAKAETPLAGESTPAAH
jgi:hypothetical protein